MPLSGWNFDRRIRIDVSGADSTLTDFPVLVRLCSSSGKTGFDTTRVFDELGSNSLRIAFEYEDSGDELYVEIEEWDSVGENAILHVKVPTIPKSGTYLNFYYDNTHPDNTSYVGVQGSTPAQNVWDSGFVGVYHFNNDPSGSSPQITDSTSNGNHGTVYGSMSSSDVVQGTIVKGLQFDGTDDYVDLGNDSSLDIGNDDTHSIFLCIRPSSSSGDRYQGVYSKKDDTIDEGISVYLDSQSNNMYYYLYDDSGHMGSTYCYNISDDVDNFVYVGRNSTKKKIRCGDSYSSSNTTTNPPLTNSGVSTFIGRRYVNLNQEYFKGILFEVRISNVDRSSSWYSHTMSSIKDDLLTYKDVFVFSHGVQYRIDVPGTNTELTDFPLCIQLHENSGVTNFDCTRLFRLFHKTSDVDDNFHGVDGSAPNSTLWDSTRLDVANNNIQNNKLHFDISALGGNVYRDIVSNYVLTDDLFIEIEFDSFTSTHIYSGIELNLINNFDNSRGYVKVSLDRFMCNVRRYDSWDNYTYVARTNDFGKLAIERTGNTLKFYYADGNGSRTLLHSYGHVFNSDATVYISAWAVDGNSMQGNVSSYIRSSGSVSWDSNSKFQVIQPDNTPCYVEIERWDTYNKRAVLHVRVPTIPTSGTSLFLQADNSASVSNLDYVGETGTPASEKVWDDDFLVVSHMVRASSIGSLYNSTNREDDVEFNRNNTNVEENYHEELPGSIIRGTHYNSYTPSYFYFVNSDFRVPHPVTMELVYRSDGRYGACPFSCYDYATGSGTRDFLQWDGNSTREVFIKNSNLSTGSHSFSTDAMCYTGASFNNPKFQVVFDDTLVADQSEDNPPLSSIYRKYWGIGCDADNINPPNGNYFYGVIGEVRLSVVDRSVDWMKMTSSSYRDDLLTISNYYRTNTSSKVYSLAYWMFNSSSAKYSLKFYDYVRYLSSTFSLCFDVENSLTSPYALAFFAVNDLSSIYSLAHYLWKDTDIKYSISLAYTNKQPYGNSPVSTSTLHQHYGGSYFPIRVNTQLYGDCSILTMEVSQWYSLLHSINEVLSLEYGIAGSSALSNSSSSYDILDIDKVQNSLSHNYSLVSGTSSTSTHNISLSVNGNSIEFEEISLTAGTEQYPILCEVSLDEIEFAKCNYEDNAELEINGVVFSLFVDDLDSRVTNKSLSYRVHLLSPTAKLDAPYSRTITDTLDNGGDAKSIVEQMAATKGISVDWQIINWSIPGYSISINDETPLSVIKRIVNSVGAKVQSKPNGDLLVISNYPSSVPNWSTETPVRTLSVDSDIISLDSDFDVREGYNAFTITDQGSSSKTITLEEETIDSTTKVIKGFRVPFSDGEFDLETSGGSNVRIDKYTYPVEEQIPTQDSDEEWEVVEFIDWTGRTQYPIYGVVDWDWIEDDLGAFQISEDGTLTIIDQSSVPSESLLRIKYKTKYWKWTVTGPVDIPIQFYVPEIED